RLAYALPAEGASLGSPRCPSCDEPIALLAARGASCPSCRAPLAYDRVEWLLAGLFILLAARFGPGGPLIAYSVYTVALLAIAAIDLRHRYIYSIVSYPSLVAAV